MFASASYGQIWSWYGGDSCRSSVLTVKETYYHWLTRFSVFAWRRTDFSWFTRNLKGGWVGYGAGSSFLVDFNIISHINLSPSLQIVTYILYSVLLWGNTPTFYAHVIVSNLLWFQAWFLAWAQYGRTTPKFSCAIVTGFRSPVSSVGESFHGVVLPYWSDLISNLNISNLNISNFCSNNASHGLVWHCKKLGYLLFCRKENPSLCWRARWEVP